MDYIQNDPILEFNPLTLEQARKCWGLDKWSMQQSIKIIEEWIKKQNHFLNKNFDRKYLESTIIACKGWVEKSKIQFDKLCTMKTLLPNFFLAKNIRRSLEDIMDLVWMFALPKMTKNNERIFFTKIPCIKNLSTKIYMQFFQLIITYCEYLKLNDYSNGQIVMIDFRGANLLDIITKLNIVELQQMMTILIDGFGARMKGIHILTESKTIDLLVKILKTVLSAKIGSRIQVHHDLKGFQSVVDKNILPVEYGGEERSIDILRKEWLDILCSKENEIQLTKSKLSCTDENLRATEKYNEQIMGLPGSFRTLNVD